MHPMRSFRWSRVRILVAAAVCVATAAVDAAAQPVQLPAEAGPFVLSDSLRYDRPGPSMAYRYQDPAERVTGDAFVYPVGADLLASPDSQRIATEAEAFIATLAEGVELGWYSDYRVVVNEAREWETADGPRPGYLVAFVQRREDGAYVSFMHLVLLGDHYVKTRLTLPAEQWRTSAAPDFALDLFKQLRPAAAAAP